MYLFLIIDTKAQIGIGTPNPNAALDITSTAHGILIPRLTAAQAEAISSPAIGELVYATTNSGTIINKAGFWYYDGTTWKSFGAPAQTNIDIANGDGTLTSNRTVTMNGNNLTFDPDIITILSTTQKTGIGDSTPEHTLDINGNTRVRNLSNGNVVALTDGTLAIGPKVPYGTVKESLRSTDHNGWYRLDGRALNTLPASAQTNATTLGISGTLINANNLLMKQGSSLATGGTSNISLLRANLPNYTMTGTTSAAADHTHSVLSGGQNMNAVAAGNAFIVRAGRGTSAGNIATTLSTAAAHLHTGNAASGGSATPLSIVPESITYTYFIYLGQ